MEYKVGDKFEIEVDQVEETVYTNRKIYHIKSLGYFQEEMLNNLVGIGKIINCNTDINVNDVVTVNGGDILFVCTKDNINGDSSRCALMADDGSMWEDVQKNMCYNTGKKVDIASVLDALENIK